MIYYVNILPSKADNEAAAPTGQPTTAPFAYIWAMVSTFLQVSGSRESRVRPLVDWASGELLLVKVAGHFRLCPAHAGVT